MPTNKLTRNIQKLKIKSQSKHSKSLYVSIKFLFSFFFFYNLLYKIIYTKKKIIHDIIECSKSSLESFSLAFPCLRKNANNTISNIDFCSSFFKHEIHENDIETISNSLKFLFENTDDSQHSNILLPLVTLVTLQIHFILDVIEDVRDYSLIYSNFVHIIHPLRI